MKLFKIRQNNAVFLALLFLLMNTLSAYAEEEAEGGEEEEEPERTCQKTIWNIIEKFLQGTSNCLGGKLVLRSPFELGTRFYCLFKCILMDLGVLGANGKLDEVSALFFFEEAIPAVILDVVLSDAGPCLDMASQFIPSQYYCQSYGNFVQCVFRSLVKTLGPYALECFTTPGLGFFFSFINFIVPQPSVAASSATANEVRRRYSKETERYKKKLIKTNNSTLILNSRSRKNGTRVQKA